MKIIEFIAAVILSVFLLPIGIFYNIITFWKKSSMKMPFLFVTAFFIEIYNLFHTLAVFIDRLGNIILGKIFRDCFIKNKELDLGFGRFGITISASFGMNLTNENLTKKGLKLSLFIDSIFGAKHCVNAFMELENNLYFKTIKNENNRN